MTLGLSRWYPLGNCFVKRPAHAWRSSVTEGRCCNDDGRKQAIVKSRRANAVLTAVVLWTSRERRTIGTKPEMNTLFATIGRCLAANCLAAVCFGTLGFVEELLDYGNPLTGALYSTILFGVLFFPIGFVAALIYSLAAPLSDRVLWRIGLVALIACLLSVAAMVMGYGDRGHRQQLGWLDALPFLYAGLAAAFADTRFRRWLQFWARDCSRKRLSSRF